jgi:spore maturation protein CgeB
VCAFGDGCDSIWWQSVKVLLLWCLYPDYIRLVHAEQPKLRYASFLEQREYYLSDFCGWPASLSLLMRRSGVDAEFIVANDEFLQRAWASEHGFHPGNERAWLCEIAREQVKVERPDVLWLSSWFDFYGAFVRDVRSYAGRIVTWVGEPWPTPPDMDGISVLITENPATFREIHSRFDRVIVTKPGFDPAIVAAIGPVQRTTDVSYVGQISRVHRRRAALLAGMLRKGINVTIAGWQDKDVPKSRWESFRTGLRQSVHSRGVREGAGTICRALWPAAFDRDRATVARAMGPPVFGLRMLRTLAGSRVVVNTHADFVGNHAGNMRLFEATGVGAGLLTEQSDNIGELFEPGKEILTYRTNAEALDLVRQALDDGFPLESIAAAGQARTLREHNLERFLERIRPILT